MNHRRAQKLLELAALGKAKPKHFRSLEPHLQGCASCKARYDKIRMVESILAAPEGGPSFSPIQLERGLAKIEMSLPAPVKSRTGIRALLALSAATLALLLVIIKPPKDSITPRGLMPSGSQFKLQIYCVRSTGGEDTAFSKGCKVGDRLQISYRASAKTKIEALELIPPKGEPQTIITERSLDKSAGPRALGRAVVATEPGQWKVTARHPDASSVIWVKRAEASP